MSLATRATTGLIFGTIMIGATLASGISAAILFFLVGLCCLWELHGHVLAKDGSVALGFFRKLYATLLGLLPALLVLNVLYGSAFQVSDSGYWLFPIVFLPFLVELFAGSERPFENIGYQLLGAVYIGIPTALWLAFALKDDTGHYLLLAMMLLVWMNDVFAYLTGSRIGKTKLIPRVSPGKTWEGTAGGVLGALLSGIACFYIFDMLGYALWQWLVFAAICSVFAILGDLVESILKRSLGIKDSGTILPGHGGFLDRFDALLFVTPFAAFAIIHIFQDARYLVWFL